MKKLLYTDMFAKEVVVAEERPHKDFDYAQSDNIFPGLKQMLSGRAKSRPVQIAFCSRMILVVGMLFLVVFNTVAQGGGKKEKIEALRVAFITQELNLTEAESQKFWPVYNEYQDKLKAARKEFKAIATNFATDKEAQDFLDAELLFKQRELSLYKEYYDKFKKIIPIKKVAQLRQAEEDFKKELLKQLQGKNNE